MAKEVKMDMIGKGTSTGPVASQAAGLNSGKLRPFIDEKTGRSYITVHTGGSVADAKNFVTQEINTNATLRRDEWKQLDMAVIGVSRSRLVGINDLRTRGLVYKLGNALGTTVLESHELSDAFEAELSMDGLSRTQGDRPEYTTTYLPIPIIHVDYEINARVLEASRKLGNPLDTSSAELASRKVSEKLESLLFTSTTYKFGGGTIYSYLNHPDRNTVTLSTHWDASGKTGADIVKDVRNMKQANINAKHYGPYVLYIPTAYETVLDADYDSTTPGTTIRERILKIANIASVQVIDTLVDNNVLLIQMTSDVVRLVSGMPITNVQWGEQGNMVTQFKVMSIEVPQVRSDTEGNSGVCQLA